MAAWTALKHLELENSRLGQGGFRFRSLRGENLYGPGGRIINDAREGRSFPIGSPSAAGSGWPTVRPEQRNYVWP